MRKSYRLVQKNFRDLKSEVVDIAILPWGATEPHGYHLPYGTDSYQSEEVAALSAELAAEKGVNPLVLPVLPFGVQNEGQRELTGCINLRPTTLLTILDDIAASLIRQGIQRLIILNSHGGNDFRFAIRELQLKHPNLLMVAVDWWRHPIIRTLVDNPGDHAGALETCVMMHLKPELVSPETGTGRSVGFNIKALNEGWAWTPRNWAAVSEDTGIGDPRGTTPETGKIVVDRVVAEIAELIVKLVKEENIYQKL